MESQNFQEEAKLDYSMKHMKQAKFWEANQFTVLIQNTKKWIK